MIIISSGDIFDSVGYRGVDFSSDERILPSSMLGYAPQIRGMAKTNAKIEIWQKDQLIYQSSVGVNLKLMIYTPLDMRVHWRFEF